MTLLTHSELAPGSLHLTFLILHFLIEQVASQDCQIALQSIPNLCNAIPLRCSQANPSMLLILVQSTSACPRTNTSSKIRAGWVCKLRLRQPDRDSLIRVKSCHEYAPYILVETGQHISAVNGGSRPASRVDGPYHTYLERSSNLMYRWFSLRLVQRYRRRVQALSPRSGVVGAFSANSNPGNSSRIRPFPNDTLTVRLRLRIQTLTFPRSLRSRPS